MGARSAPMCLSANASHRMWAASLRMVPHAYYGKWVPLSELRDACGASRDGTSLAEILRASTPTVSMVTAVSCGLQKLAKYGYPVILFWANNHFVVLEEVVDGGARLNDPHQVSASSHEELEKTIRA